MKMKMKMVCSVVLAIGLLFGGTVSAQTSTDRVTVSQNDMGDTLLAPLYETIQNDTIISVINTDQTTAVVAKIVFRSPGVSDEVRDFLLYLSPGDVWEGIITLSDDGVNATLTSTDDSCLTSDAPTFANAITPLTTTFVIPASGDINSFGHIEIFGASAYNTGSTAVVAKADIFNAYHNTGLLNGVAASDVPNVLAGRVTLVRKDTGAKASLNMTALEDYETAPFFPTITFETQIGDSNNNNTAEVEAAIAKDILAVPFDISSGTYADEDVTLVATFPTKYRINRVESVYDEFYNKINTTEVDVTLIVTDMEENEYSVSEIVSPVVRSVDQLPSEVNLVSLPTIMQNAIAAGFIKGWLQVDLQGGSLGAVANDGVTALSYTGGPVLASTLTYDNAEAEVDWNNVFSNGSVVTYGGIAVRQ